MYGNTENKKEEWIIILIIHCLPLHHALYVDVIHKALNAHMGLWNIRRRLRFEVLKRQKQKNNDLYLRVGREGLLELLNALVETDHSAWAFIGVNLVLLLLKGKQNSVIAV